jgi:hypothetical protein
VRCDEGEEGRRAGVNVPVSYPQRQRRHITLLASVFEAASLAFLSHSRSLAMLSPLNPIRCLGTVLEEET